MQLMPYEAMNDLGLQSALESVRGVIDASESGGLATLRELSAGEIASLRFVVAILTTHDFDDLPKRRLEHTDLSRLLSRLQTGSARQRDEDGAAGW